MRHAASRPGRVPSTHGSAGWQSSHGPRQPTGHHTGDRATAAAKPLPRWWGPGPLQRIFAHYVITAPLPAWLPACLAVSVLTPNPNHGLLCHRPHSATDWFKTPQDAAASTVSAALPHKCTATTTPATTACHAQHPGSHQVVAYDVGLLQEQSHLVGQVVGLGIAGRLQARRGCTGQWHRREYRYQGSGRAAV